MGSELTQESGELDHTRHDRSFGIINGIVSAAALAFLAWLLLLAPGARGETGGGLEFMPAVNACLNALSAVLLSAGWIAIRSGRMQLHRTLMVSAFASSAVFLVGYVVYHYLHGDTPYTGQGTMRTVYFTVLISHILLSMAVVPMALTSFYLAFQKRFKAHARLNRIALPIWLYVSVTGVVIYFMLRGG